ncbi:MAG: CbiQ family ECF transporter T component [Micrococcales bacterium]
MQLVRRFRATAWLVAIALVILVSITKLLWLNLAIVVVASALVFANARKSKSAVPTQLLLSLTFGIILIRVLFRLLFSGGAGGSDTLWSLPVIRVNFGLGNLDLLGPVTWSAISQALFDGSRLAAMVAVITAVNLVVDSRQLLRRAPGALFEISTSVLLALNFIPELTKSIARIRKASRLRGHARGLGYAAIAVPVFEDAFERSFQLAATMDVRGFGRRAPVDATRLRLARFIAVVGLCLDLLAVVCLMLGGLLLQAIGALIAGLALGAIAVSMRSNKGMTASA